MFEHFIDNELHTYGPFAVFLLLMLSGIGLPLGEDIITIPAGALIATGHLDFWTTAIYAYCGVVGADLLWFIICSRYGTPLLHKKWFKRLIHPRRLLQAKHQFEQRGTALIVMARFIPSSRTTTITIAGLLHMPFWKFALATLPCVLITVPLQLGLGYLIGRGLGTQSGADLIIRVVGLVAIIVAVMLIVNWLRGRRALGRTPRARARWLRLYRRGGLKSSRVEELKSEELVGEVEELKC